MYIETRYYDNGKVEAKLHKGFSYPQLEKSNKFDRYVESIGKSMVQSEADNSSDYETIEHWTREMQIKQDKVSTLVTDLETEEWVDITNCV